MLINTLWLKCDHVRNKVVSSFGLTGIRQLQLTLGELDPSLKLMTNITHMLSISLKKFLPDFGIV